MSNGKLIFGIAAGVAAIAGTALYAHKKGLIDLNELCNRAEDEFNNFKNKRDEKLNSLEQKINNSIDKGYEFAEKAEIKAEEWVEKNNPPAL